ncbi:MAG: hypothetical protein RR365_06095 [Bacteroides sp.]
MPQESGSRAAPAVQPCRTSLTAVPKQPYSRAAPALQQCRTSFTALLQRWCSAAARFFRYRADCYGEDSLPRGGGKQRNKCSSNGTSTE